MPKVAPTRYPSSEQTCLADPDKLHESLLVNAIQGTIRHSVGAIGSSMLPPSLLGTRRSSMPSKYIVSNETKRKRRTPKHRLYPDDLDHSTTAQRDLDLNTNLSIECLQNQATDRTHLRRQSTRQQKHRHSRRHSVKSAYKVNIDSHVLAQYRFVNTSSNANEPSFDANVSSTKEMIDADVYNSQMERVARYNSYYRFLLGARQSASVKPVVTRGTNRRVTAVMALNAADNRQASPLTTDEVQSLLRATVLRRGGRPTQTATY